MVPGLPTVPFFLLSGFTGFVSLYILQARNVKDELSMDTSQETAKDAMKKPENLLGTLSLDPISLKTGRNLVPLIDPNRNGPLLERITLVRYHIGQDLGFVIPGVRVMDDLGLEANQYLVEIRGTRVATGEAIPGHLYVHRSSSELARLGVDSVEAIDPILGDSGSWVSEDQAPVLQENSIPFSNVTDFVSDHFAEAIKQHADEIMIRQNVQSLLELVKNTNAAIVRELVPDMRYKVRINNNEGKAAKSKGCDKYIDTSNTVTDAPIFKTINISSAHDGTGNSMIEIIMRKTKANITSESENSFWIFLNILIHFIILYDYRSNHCFFLLFFIFYVKHKR